MDDTKDFAKMYYAGVAKRAMLVLGYCCAFVLLCLWIDRCSAQAELAFEKQPVYEISNILPVDGSDIVIVSFTTGNNYEMQKQLLDYGLEKGTKIRFDTYSGRITKVKVVPDKK